MIESNIAKKHPLASDPVHIPAKLETSGQLVDMIVRGRQAGLSAAEVEALLAMQPGCRYRLDAKGVQTSGINPIGAQLLIDKGFAHDISSSFAGSIRGAVLSAAGEILHRLITCEGSPAEAVEIRVPAQKALNRSNFADDLVFGLANRSCHIASSSAVSVGDNRYIEMRISRSNEPI